jgi:acetolactate synthase-1/2/3 large subunit
MNGAESLIQTAVDAGVSVCFANPGTTEMPLVAALDAVPGMRAVLGLFEGVCTGAADGYGRMTGEPALTLVHLGPGFANGIANLHNARRARSPIVNLIGDHATWHLEADAPLTSDIDSLARPVSSWVRKSQSAGALASDVADAIRAARSTPQSVATLIAPHDFQGEKAAGPARVPRVAEPASVSDAEIASAAEALGREGALLFLGGVALSRRGLTAAARIGAATGARLVHETFFARIERGAGLPQAARLPYFPEQAEERLAGATSLVCAGAGPPISFFGYPGKPSSLVPAAASVQVLAPPDCAVEAALEALAERVGATADAPVATGALAAVERSGELTPGSLGRNLAALQPEGVLIVDEGTTAGLAWFGQSTLAPPHTVLALTGGAIGQGLPCAVGAAIACPDRKVIALQADGSGMYTLQALWTMARESLDVVVVICSNRRYRILQVELARAGIAEPGPKAQALTDLGQPDLDWTALARGMGVPGVRAESAGDFADALARALAEAGPCLIEAVI